MIRKLLVANRGEIAVRVIRACRELGIHTVAVYSEADKEALHTQLADESICIGPASAKESYLDMEALISAAVVTQADAIHPGFGFLSENATFAKLCNNCNITWIGPDYTVMELMADKVRARQTMIKAGVPVIPGTQDPVETVQKAIQTAKKIGYPVMIKAVSGGGGKGMRLAANESELKSAFLTAGKEAQAAFGDGRLYLEHYIDQARHVEVQILADHFGNVIHLGERDCSIQRQNQKVIEESPCIMIDEKLRTKIGKTAVRAAKAAGYKNAGTIEFLLTDDDKFYFMEMNTRIQVEHPVTECVTGIDLIKEQIRIAEGQKLSFSQKEVQIHGHAIECRINAENPAKKFMPCPGRINEVFFPGGNGVRVDSAIYPGYDLPPYYDSMLAKIIVHGKNREEAICKMRSALGEIIVEGITTNVDFLYSILDQATYRDGTFNTHWLENEMENGTI